MARLGNVLVAEDLTTIMYGGDTYYRLADGQDAQAGDLFYVTRSDSRYVARGGVYEVVGVYIDGPQLDDEDGDLLDCANNTRDGIYFRKGPATTAELLAAKRAEAAALAAEIAVLETKLRGEIIGSIAIVTGGGYHEDIPVGTLVKVMELDEDYEEYPYRVELLDGSDFDRFDLDSLEPVTYESARAHLLAEVDRQLAAAFESTQS